MTNDKNWIDENVLEEVNGGAGGGPWTMTVTDCGGGGSYLALRPEPKWDNARELMKLYPGYQVLTYGTTTRGTGLYGTPCTYTYVCFNNTWGWVNSNFIR